MNSRHIEMRLVVGAVILGGATGAAAGSSLQAAYEYSFQEMYGAAATFYVSGPATMSSPDVQGDGILDAVEYPNGETYTFFYKPTYMFGLKYQGDPSGWEVRAGSNCTVGLNTSEVFGTSEGDPTVATNGEREHFQDLIREAFNNNNLNNLLDLRLSANFSFIIAFDQIVMDNDPGPDDFGEILFFERGSGSGNSWFKITPVNEMDQPLGPTLVLSPNETRQTTPVTTVSSSSQTVGATSIDVSRLGVSEFQYLRVSNDVSGEAAYTGGGDLYPDFKIMAVITNQQQLQMQVLGTFD